ncbi:MULTISPECIES: type 1 glutamine amidotransferase domain-containing protein [Pontibacillus]|uniref:Type 1 glutamine amidotransferase domain-containing protein n=1 Tax=Pontibacillus chungwhensis TaxID=265426 RepID=A0ABY8UX71_9BACI|nr:MULTISPECIES: type 1 glutamine amidotransferase domain-containing protein [Pontibacillus]MCD5323981.1 type 1 glutamine amidotransferase domain-containing protein [Pontibacillus sp. HN14]WIF97955.1 type 1 glutamine amidotransferase domain-containing protein [Pontibacillus chungwhensis]
MAKKMLMIVTNAGRLDEDHQTGLWLSEFAEPFMEFTQAGYDVTVASVAGGEIPIDPHSISGEEPDEWEGVMEPLKDTAVLSDLNTEEYDGVFLPGGHGTMVDFPDNEAIKKALQPFFEQDKVIGSVCHGTAAFVGVTNQNGKPFIDGKRITAFTNAEEKDQGLDEKVPFLLETRLTEIGANFMAEPNYTEHVEADGNLVTGQNPQSSLAAARKVVQKLGQ